MEDISQPAPVRRVNKKLFAGVAVGLLLLIALVYFFVLPAQQISSYKSGAEAAHRQVNDKMLRVYDSFKRGAFTDPKSTPEKDKLDVQVAREAVKDAENAINANAAAMTKFQARPLLSWNRSYKQATDTDAAEEKYVKQSKAFLADYKNLLDYTDKTGDIGIKMNEAFKDLDNLGDQATPAAMATMIDNDIAKVKPLIGEYQAVAPPVYLKSNTDEGIRVVNQVIVTLQDLSSGVRTLDLAKLSKAASDIQKEQSAVDAAGQNFIDILQHKSPVQSGITQLRDLDGKITAGYAKI